MAGLLAVVFVGPWAIYFLRSGLAIGEVITSGSPAESSLLGDSGFDNHFHERPPEEKIERATVIFVTRVETDNERHKEVISEFVKRGPDIRFYYEVGDELERSSHLSGPDCDDCIGDGRVVFLLGNPAMMASSYSYRDGRIDAMGGLSLHELRELANAAQVAGQ